VRRASSCLPGAALFALATSARAQSAAPATAATAATCEPRRAPEPSLPGRVTAEVLTGAALASVGFVAAPELVGAACHQCVYAAGLAGASAAFPIGVYWGGSLARGRGSFWLTVAAPWLASAAALTATITDQDYDGSPAFQIGAIGGAVAAPISVLLYELSSRRAETRRETASSPPRFAVAPRQGGVAIHVGGAF
jgi:hypothetical protein